MKNLQTTLFVMLLCTVAGSVMWLKYSELGIPLLPGQMEPVWSIEAKIDVVPSKRGIIVNFDIPDKLDDYILLDEYFVARNYGLNIEKVAGDRRAEWSTRQARGKQQLFYRVEIAPNSDPLTLDEKSSKKIPPAPEIPDYPEPLRSAVDELLEQVRSESANVFTFVSQLLVKLNSTAPEANIKLIRDTLAPGTDDWVERVIYILSGARITARLVRGIELSDGASQTSLTPWLEVHNGKYWQGFDPTSGNKGYPPNFVRWSTGSNPILEVENAKSRGMSFATSKYTQTLTSVARDRASVGNSWLANLLLFDLPVSTQNVYRTLLMVPIGALIVAFMRTIVGMPTLGTFMPILIAIAFRETELALGITLFVLITGVGLLLRFYLERLQLLLVPRLCAVLILVVLMMLAISLISADLGLARGFSVALFPIVILTMVIEHMSVVWEESGPIATLKEGLGSLAVAILGYLAMINEYLSHIVFLFPEVLLIVLAVSILIGRYTGYRVTELFRFKDIIEDKP